VLRVSRQLRRGDRANVTVEFALIAVLFLLPLVAASADFICVIAAQAQLNTALQALLYFALTNTSLATSSTEAGTIVTAINTGAVFKITMPGTLSSGATNPSYTYVCYTTGATGTVSFSAPSTSNSCSGTQTTQYFANYKVVTTVALPFAFPGLASPLTLAASGAVQTQ